MPNYKTPGVYVEEKNSFASKIEQIETAIPAFVGYTQVAALAGKSLINNPYRISSLTEFENVFGKQAIDRFDWSDANDAEAFEVNVSKQQLYLKQVNPAFHLYKSVKLFFQNGGGNCYVVSVGDYQQAITKSNLLEGLKRLHKESEPTLIVIPDAVSLPQADCYQLQNAMLSECATCADRDPFSTRFAILDVLENGTLENMVDDFRAAINSQNGGSHAAAYLPYLNTTVISTKAVGLSNFVKTARKSLADLIESDTHSSNAELHKIIAAISPDSKTHYKDEDIDRVLKASSSLYRFLLSTIKEVINIVPPSGAIAGAIVSVDAQSGVWKAPANVALGGVTSPTIPISQRQQELLNSDSNGKSLNAIRAFIGTGTMIWGARTLDSNNPEWRYINVRRAADIIETSIALMLRTYIFEPNDNNTWQTIKVSVTNFLVQLWQQGGLAGAKPDHAFSVKIGFNQTMTEHDIEHGLLKLTVHVALQRPTEFIVIQMVQNMQTA